MFETIIAANPDACRTEAEIADESGNRVAIVYEDSGGWHTEILDDRVEQPLTRFNALIENAKEVLSHYVNRRGDNVPSELTTVGALALWLMVKDGDRSEMVNILRNPKSICPIMRARLAAC